MPEAVGVLRSALGRYCESGTEEGIVEIYEKSGFALTGELLTLDALHDAVPEADSAGLLKARGRVGLRHVASWFAHSGATKLPSWIESLFSEGPPPGGDRPAGRSQSGKWGELVQGAREATR